MRVALVATLACAVGLGAISVAAKKKGGKQPRGPYPGLGTCGVFPKPRRRRTPPRPPTIGLEPGHLRGAARPELGSDIAHIIANGGDILHPDFG